MEVEQNTLSLNMVGNFKMKLKEMQKEDALHDKNSKTFE